MVTPARPVQRARRQEDKEARRRAIMNAAAELVETRRFIEVKMIDIARAAGLAKGTVFLYFPTKEALFLDILQELLEAWLDDLNAALDGGKGRWTSARVARVITESLVSRDLFVRLLCLTTSVLEQNVEVARVIAFKRRLRDFLADTGSRLERRLEFLVPGQGAHLIMQVYAAVVGVKQLTNPGKVAAEALQETDLQPLAFDFASELGTLMGVILSGLESQAAAG